MVNVTTTNRSGAVDLFKIISMLMVVVLHVLGHGGVLSTAKPTSINWFIFGGLESVCIIAVNCFALTTGFLYCGKKIKIKNLLNLCLQVLFFSIVIAIFFFIFQNQTFSIERLFAYLFPISSKRYWYFSAYFILFLTMPLLNHILNTLTDKFLFVVLIGAMVLFCVYVYASSVFFDNTFGLDNGYGFIWLAVLYLFGGAIKKYNVYQKFKARKWLCLYLLSAGLSFSCGVIVSILTNFKILPVVADYLFILNVLSACLLLLFFASIEIKPNKIITLFSKNSFGVYLLHEHPFIRSAFIKNQFTIIATYNPFLAIVVVLGIVAGIYLLGLLIEILRKLFFKLIKVDKLVAIIDNKITSLYNK